MQDPGEAQLTDLSAFSDEARVHLQRAIDLARARAGRYWGPEHVLLAVLDDPTYAAGVEALGGDVAAMRRAVKVVWSQTEHVVAPRTDVGGTADPLPTQRIQRLLRAAIEDPDLGPDGVGLLAALATDPANVAGALLLDQGLTPEVVRTLRVA